MARAPFRVVSCLLCLAFLHTTQAAACTNRFTNLTVCSAFNGLPADGPGTPAHAKYLELEVARLYDTNPTITKNDACRALFYTHHCLINGQTMLMTNVGSTYQYSGPCAADGTRLRSPCFDSCVEFHRLCYFGMVRSQREETCNTQAAPRDSNVCFGDAGVNGMKAAVPATAPSLAPRILLAPLALALSLVRLVAVV